MINESARPNDVLLKGDGFAAVPYELLRSVRNTKAVALYAILAMHADWQTGLCHPSVKRLTEMMGYSSRKAFDEGLDTLTQAGWVEVFPRWIVADEDGERVVYERPEGDGWRQTSNGYIVHRTAPDPVPDRDRGGSLQGKGGSSLEGTGGVPYREHEQEPLKQEPEEQENNPQPPAEVEGDFDTFWAAYPRKVAKAAARTAFKKAMKQTTLEELMEGLRRSISSWRVEGRDKTKLPYPATWLNQGRWEDEETTAADMRAPDGRPLSATERLRLRTQGANSRPTRPYSGLTERNQGVLPMGTFNAGEGL